MAIRTNIDVSAFNIIRYLILNLVVDVLVRKSLDSFEHFRRRLSLYHGRSVSLTGLRIDRYNLIRTVSTGQLFSAFVLFLITILAYGVEVALEYAVDSRAIRYPNRGIITRAEYKQGVCSLDNVFTGVIPLGRIAEQCVVFEDGTYRFYNPLWTKKERGSFGLLCEAAEENKLFEGIAVYNAGFESQEAPEVNQLVQTLEENSYKSVGDQWHTLIILDISSKDVIARRNFVTPAARFSIVFFLKLIPGTTVHCFGFGSGRQDQDTLVLQLIGCTNGFDDNSSLVLTYGTGVVQIGTEEQDGDWREWNAQVPFEIRLRIPHFFIGVAVESSSAEMDAKAYASFLSRSFPQDVINLNKYAIVYRFCDQITLPVDNGTSWEEEFEFSSSQVRVTATVEEWGIMLVACWVVIVTAVQFGLTRLADRKKMPDNLFGERHILRRWAEEKWGDSVQEDNGQAFLSVGEGLKSDHITATLRRRIPLVQTGGVKACG